MKFSEVFILFPYQNIHRDEKSKGVDTMKVTTKIQKWGNSLAVNIPKDMAKQINLKQDQEVELKVTDNGIELSPKKQKPTLEELTAQVTDENHHAEVDWGKPEGRECW